jgi:3-hydroxybutyryl-CoA dehydrogenase
MKIGIIGSEKAVREWQSRLDAPSSFACLQDTQEHRDCHVLLDLDFDKHPERLREYASNDRTLFLLNAVECTLEQAYAHCQLVHSGQRMLGINAWPICLERPELEATNPFSIQVEPHELEACGFESVRFCDSRVGMITPRIISMIINEAHYTVQEGTADSSAIDTAMKLGTNYPKGPFEWLSVWGLERVYPLLEALYQDSHEERYKIAARMKQDWLRAQIK